MAGPTSDIRLLLKAARRGDFTALLAAADYWAESDNRRLVWAWDRLMEMAVRHARMAPGRKISNIASLAHSFHAFARTVAVETQAWRVPGLINTTPERYDIHGRYRRHRILWTWMREMSFHLLKHAKAVRAAQANHGSDE